MIESLDGLDLVDAELLKVEVDPDYEQTLQSIFRTIHSMKWGVRLPRVRRAG